MAATKRERHHEATREQILATARGLMLEEGPSGLRIREVARRCGLGAASLYTYFDGREALLDALVDEALRGLVVRLDGVAGELPDDRLVACGLAVWDFARDEPADFDALVNAGARDVLRDADDGALGEALARLAEPLTQILASTPADERAAAVAEAAWGVWALALGLAVLGEADDAGARRARERARRALTTYVGAVAAPV